MMKHAALCLLVALSGVCLADERADRIRVVSAGIDAGIRWQKKWFGGSFGSECVMRRLAQGNPIRILLPRTPVEDGDPDVAVHVAGGNVMYSGPLWPDKASLQPAAGNSDGCREGEIAANVDFGSADGEVISGRERHIAGGPTQGLSAKDRTAVEDYLRRTLRRRSDVVGRLYAVQVGHYFREDPLLIVCDAALQRCYFVEFPPIGAIAQIEAGAVTNAEIFLGPDGTRSARAESRNHLIAAMRTDAFLLRLDGE